MLPSVPLACKTNLFVFEVVDFSKIKSWLVIFSPEAGILNFKLLFLNNTNSFFSQVKYFFNATDAGDPPFELNVAFRTSFSSVNVWLAFSSVETKTPIFEFDVSIVEEG
jgi:hypothetical protein